jgi:hypothetical protein
VDEEFGFAARCRSLGELVEEEVAPCEVAQLDLALGALSAYPIRELESAVGHHARIASERLGAHGLNRGRRLVPGNAQLVQEDNMGLSYALSQDP